MSTERIANNLIVNFLPQFVSDDEFKNMFLSIGPVRSSRIVRDKITGLSHGFGFVEYEVDNDAERAVKIFDGLQMYGKRIKVQHSNKNDEQQKAFNVYVKNIPSNYTETELDKLFEPYGKIITSKVLMDLQTGQSRNVGFVLYGSKDEADKAIGAMHGKTVEGSSSSLIVKYADDATKKAAKAITPIIPQILTPLSVPAFPPPVPRNNNFSPVGTPGPVRNQPVNRNRFNPMARTNTPNNDFSLSNFNFSNNNNFNSGDQNGGFFGMTSPQNSGMNSPNIEIPKGPAPYSIFVCHIGDDAEERELWALFSPFGTVQKCTVMMDADKKKSKGYGFVDMANATEAANAIKNLNGFYYKGRQLNVSFKHKKQ